MKTSLCTLFILSILLITTSCVDDEFSNTDYTQIIKREKKLIYDTIKSSSFNTVVNKDSTKWTYPDANSIVDKDSTKWTYPTK